MRSAGSFPAWYPNRFLRPIGSCILMSLLKLVAHGEATNRGHNKRRPWNHHCEHLGCRRWSQRKTQCEYMYHSSSFFRCRGFHSTSTTALSRLLKSIHDININIASNNNHHGSDDSSHQETPLLGVGTAQTKAPILTIVRPREAKY